MITEFAFVTVTLKVTGAPASMVGVFVVMLTVVAAEGCTVMGVLAEAVWLPAPLAVAV
jgi:hypothetical protein